MIFLCTICSIVAIGAITMISNKDFWQILTKKQRTVYIIVTIISIILATVFFFNSSCADSGGDNAWNQLSDEEKDWYHRNYGDGKSQQYDDALKDYRGY